MTTIRTDGVSDRDASLLFDLISTVPGYNPPNQARSSEKTHAIIEATLSLLQERSAGSIRMQDISERAGCAVTAIYARFADRDVLYSAIHLLQLQECRLLLDEKMRLENFKETGILGLAHAFMEVNEFYFTKNFNFVVAQLKSDTDTAYRVTHEVMDAYARRLADLAATLLELDVNLLLQPMKLAIHTTLAIYRDSVLGIAYFERPSQETLAHIFVSIIDRRFVR